ncbi:DUF2946 family protein [Methylobacillus caricis]|uniref:DUF2946 family protein n=1 Tax=Methylobacillus caricis TaxID=1971611 RepID=UPI001CFF7884|nr:DUF2946 family protein [Methylobacillus caricis]
MRSRTISTFSACLAGLALLLACLAPSVSSLLAERSNQQWFMGELCSTKAPNSKQPASQDHAKCPFCVAQLDSLASSSLSSIPVMLSRLTLSPAISRHEWALLPSWNSRPRGPPFFH